MPLTKKQLKELEEKLISEKNRILKHLNELKEEVDTGPELLSGDPVDVASAEVSQASIAKLGDREKKLLKLINHALEKMKDESYGICEHSGDEIPFKRLQISPWAKYTVEAKEEIERRERGYVKNDGSYNEFDFEQGSEDDD
jgi:DnaK suppressor protein